MPLGIRTAKLVKHKREVIWSFWLLQGDHTCLFQATVSFLVITLMARTDQIFPRIITTQCFWQYVIRRHQTCLLTTVLTLMIVSFYDILLG